jgi:hypothetical protein
MKAIDIDRELQELVAGEELLAFFDFLLRVESADGVLREVEGLCKVSRPRERRSRSTYLSVFFVIDATDQAVLHALEAHMKQVDWNACGEATDGVDVVVAIPHRGGGAGLFLKEIDVYLDGSRPPDPAFVREVLQPALVTATGLRPGALTVWDEPADPGAVSAERDSLVARLRRLAGTA